MLRFLNFLTLYNYVGFLCVAVGLYQYIQGKKWVGTFLSFIIFSVFVEVFLNFYLITKYNSSETMYSIFSFFCPAFYLYVFYRFFENKSWADFLKYAIVTWAFFSLVVLVLSNKSFEPFPYYTGMVFTVIMTFVYFYQLLYVDSYREVIKEGMFYFSLGLMLFFFTSFTTMVFFDELIMNENMPRFYLSLLQYGNLFLWFGYLGVLLCPRIS